MTTRFIVDDYVDASVVERRDLRGLVLRNANPRLRAEREFLS